MKKKETKKACKSWPTFMDHRDCEDFYETKVEKFSTSSLIVVQQRSSNYE